MSQPAGTERPAGGGGNPLTRKYGGVPGWGWIAIVSLIAGGVFWYIQRRKSGSAAAAAPGGATQATCYDANGNTVDCSSSSAVGSNATDYFEALYAQQEGINSQLENITAQGTETGLDVDALEKLLKELQGEESSEKLGIPGPPVPGGQKPGAVRDLTVTVLGPKRARVTWRPPAVTSPTGVMYRIEIEGKDKAPRNLGPRTFYVAGGLNPGGHYTATVWPVSRSAPGGPGRGTAALQLGPPASKAFTMPLPGPHPPQPGGPNVPAGNLPGTGQEA